MAWIPCQEIGHSNGKHIGNERVRKITWLAQDTWQKAWWGEENEWFRGKGNYFLIKLETDIPNPQSKVMKMQEI